MENKSEKKERPFDPKQRMLGTAVVFSLSASGTDETVDEARGIAFSSKSGAWAITPVNEPFIFLEESRYNSIASRSLLAHAHEYAIGTNKKRVIATDALNHVPLHFISKGADNDLFLVKWIEISIVDDEATATFICRK